MQPQENEDLWFWYKHIEAWQQTELPAIEYCRAYDLDYRIFAAMRYKMIYRRENNPEQYAKFVALGREYQSSPLSREKFCKHSGISNRTLTDIVLHLNTLDRIEELKKLKEQEPMNFIQVPKTISKPNIYKKPQEIEPVQVPQHAEVIEAQNDLEIIISKGVKVSISPNIDTMKVIKIIELLKDL